MNCTILIGRWTKDLDLKFLSGSGVAVASGTLAVDRKGKKDGEKKADFIPITIFGKQAESTVNYSGKGKLCGVKGRIQTKSYEAKDGTKKYITEVVAEEVQFLEWGDKTQKGNNSQMNNDNPFGDDITPVDDGDIPF